MKKLLYLMTIAMSTGVCDSNQAYIQPQSELATQEARIEQVYKEGLDKEKVVSKKQKATQSVAAPQQKRPYLIMD